MVKREDFGSWKGAIRGQCEEEKWSDLGVQFLAHRVETAAPEIKVVEDNLKRSEPRWGVKLIG